MSRTPHAVPALLQDASRRAARYLATIDDRAVAPSPEAIARLDRFEQPFPEHGEDPAKLLERLDLLGGPATVASAGGRYFGFVIGGSHPAALAANVLAGAWDQAAGMIHTSPIAARLDEIVIGWVLEALDLPRDCEGGLTTGATMANLCGLAAARHALLARKGWNAETQGLFGAPAPKVVVGDEVHVSVLKALALLGFGSERVERVPTDQEGRMRVEAFPALEEPAIICLQAGNVNSGALDDAIEIHRRAAASASWIHIDGAFGLWSRASGRRSSLAAGFELADSWSIDAHKWLNVPYDCGITLCRHPEDLRAAMLVRASYLMVESGRQPTDFTPEMSRRARAIEVWAALASLGRDGLVDLVDRCCDHAAHFAESLAAAGHEILNEVTLNQVLVSFGSDEETDRVIERIQADGTCWCGGTTWHDRRAMRISVSSWATTEEDVAISLEAILRAARP
jgi:glutamate/tyrosine decarboxylase-like PLP-dependent enzyme